MGSRAGTPQRWIWLELIGFDSTEGDLGVDAYLATVGFTPDAVCLLLSAVDFVLLHESIEQERPLPADVCSRAGHDRNPIRQRQPWTNWQLRGLVDALHERGVAVYATVFAQYHSNRHHNEWATDHPEARALYPRRGGRGGLNPLSRLADGSYFEDLFVGKLLEVMDDYGFDGWHGADGYGPLSGALYDVDFSDNMVAQFAESGLADLPPEMARDCGDDFERHKQRAEWIWRNRRPEWIDFYAQRWTAFWQRAVDALHARGKKAVINSAWGRAPWEALYRYGIDYRRIAATGVDGMVVETVAAGLALDPRCARPELHYDFLSMLMLIDACVPSLPLIFLHNTHDVVERWDAVRHAPTILEKEIYSLANVFTVGQAGAPRRCADGLLACLGDGIEAHYWDWLRERWALAFGELPRRVLGATLVWSDAAMHRQTEHFVQNRTWTLHRVLFELMAEGAPVHCAARVDDLAAIDGPILAINLHLFPQEERERLLAYRNGPLIVVGIRDETLPAADIELEDCLGPLPMWCGVYRPPAGVAMPEHRAEDSAGAADEWPEGDPLGIEEPRGYWDHLLSRPVSRGFVRAAARLVGTCASPVSVLSGAEQVTVMACETPQGSLEVAVKNKAHVYADAEIDVGQEIAALRLLTPFPVVTVTPSGSRFVIKVPPDGITVLAVDV